MLPVRKTDIDGEGDGVGSGGVGGGKLLTLLRIPNFPIFLCTSVKPICQIYAKWIKFLSCEFIVYFTLLFFYKKQKCQMYCLVGVCQINYKSQTLPSILFSSIGGCQRRRKCILCFCHNFEKTIALNSDKSLQTSNPSSRLTNFLLKTKHCKNCQSCHSQNFLFSQM